MQKILEWWWGLGIVAMLAMLLSYGLQQMYFHQDDLDWFILANRPFTQVLSAPIGDHINYLWRLLLSVEWQLFGLYFPGYLSVSLAMHAIVIWLLYRVAYETSGRRDLAVMAAALFTVNTNWTETVLWISGQTISITALFVLLAMRQVWRRRGEISSIVLACLTSALALGLPLATFIVYKKKRWVMTRLFILVVVTYLTFGADGTSLDVSLSWLAQVGIVWALIPLNSVIGRLLIPFDRFELLRIGFVVSILIYGLLRWRHMLGKVWSDVWSRFLLFHMASYYLIVAVGRAQYGVGIMRAERYAYIGLALFLLFVVRWLRHIQIGTWAWVSILIILVQSVGLYHRAAVYVVRPQQLRGVVEEVTKYADKVDPAAYLPHHVLNDDRLRYRDLIDLIHD